MSRGRAWDIRDVTLPDGRRLRVRCWPGRGRPLVLLHGLFDDAEGWDAPRPRHAPPLLRFDLPGFGGSRARRAPRISAYAEDVVAGLEACSSPDCTLVGHSLGGAIAAAWPSAAHAVGALALLAPVGFGPIASPTG